MPPNQTAILAEETPFSLVMLYYTRADLADQPPALLNILRVDTSIGAQIAQFVVGVAKHKPVSLIRLHITPRAILQRDADTCCFKQRAELFLTLAQHCLRALALGDVLFGALEAKVGSIVVTNRFNSASLCGSTNVRSC